MIPTAAAPTAECVDPVLDRLKRLHPQVIDLSLGRVSRLLAALGNPQMRLPPVVHVAGTNGKGSTIAFLRAFLEQAGHRVHVYTSPHLVRFHERIRVGQAGGGRLIEDDHLQAILEECEAANDGQPITYFEITTAAALLAFSRAPAEAVLLETGLGGRLDATNVVERPAATAITRISLDHRDFLGTTLSAIAAEKAGILKHGVPAVIAPQPSGEVGRTLRAHALATGARLVEYGGGWSVRPLPGGFRFESAARCVDLPRPGLVGDHQLVNAGVALACLDELPSLPVRDAALAEGLRAVEWPARLQRLSQGRLVESLPAGWELWLDGGHNDSAAEVLAAQGAAWAAHALPLPLAVIFAMLTSKDPLEFLARLAPRVGRLRAVALPGEHAFIPAAEAAAVARAAGIADADAAPDVAAALHALIQGAERPHRVLICGSLYLAGSVLAENG